MTFATILNVVINQINGKEGQKYFPFIFTLFMFILINNLMGLVPYSFATTSHFLLVIAWSFTVVLGSTILGFLRRPCGFYFLVLFKLKSKN